MHRLQLLEIPYRILGEVVLVMISVCHYHHRLFNSSLSNKGLKCACLLGSQDAVALDFLPHELLSLALDLAFLVKSLMQI